MISQVSHQQLLSGNRVKLTDIKSLETSISKDFCLISNETDYVLSTALRSLFIQQITLIKLQKEM